MCPHLNQEFECSGWLDLVRNHLWTWVQGESSVSFLEAPVICKEEENKTENLSSVRVGNWMLGHCENNQPLLS